MLTDRETGRWRRAGAHSEKIPNFAITSTIAVCVARSSSPYSSESSESIAGQSGPSNAPNSAAPIQSTETAFSPKGSSSSMRSRENMLPAIENQRVFRELSTAESGAASTRVTVNVP